MKSTIKFRKLFVLATALLSTFCSYVGMARPMVKSCITISSDIVSGIQRILQSSMAGANSTPIDQSIEDCSAETVFVQTSNGLVISIKENFTVSDKPDTIKLQTFKLTTPWGYNKMENKARRYPLVVNGCWGEGSLFRENVRMKYPSFYLDFNNYSTESDGVTLANLIDDAIRQNFRIDTDRIYLTGFSRGGSGSFKIVRGMLTRGKLFAGIIRVAGQSESFLPDEAVEKTSIWYHIGLKDLNVRIDVARATYSYLKGKPTNATAAESIVTDSITGYTRTTKTLTRNGIGIVKMSEYKGMGHEPGPCYNDPALFEWLFSQSLDRR